MTYLEKLDGTYSRMSEIYTELLSVRTHSVLSTISVVFSPTRVGNDLNLLMTIYRFVSCLEACQVPKMFNNSVTYSVM